MERGERGRERREGEREEREEKKGGWGRGEVRKSNCKFQIPAGLRRIFR